MEEEEATEVEQHKPEEEQEKDWWNEPRTNMNGADWSWRSKRNQRTEEWVKKMRKKLRRKRQEVKGEAEEEQGEEQLEKERQHSHAREDER